MNAAIRVFPWQCGWTGYRTPTLPATLICPAGNLRISVLSQPRVRHSEVVPGPLDEVWGLLREFDSIDRWHPGITDCTIEADGATDQVGAVRNFQAGGRTLREQIVAHSDVERFYQYRILEGSGAKENYLSELRAIPVTEREETLVVWDGSFDAPPAAMADEQEGITAVYTGGLAGLVEHFE